MAFACGGISHHQGIFSARFIRAGAVRSTEGSQRWVKVTQTALAVTSLGLLL